MDERVKLRVKPRHLARGRLDVRGGFQKIPDFHDVSFLYEFLNDV
jgi:hypothetical protein